MLSEVQTETFPSVKEKRRVVVYQNERGRTKWFTSMVENVADPFESVVEVEETVIHHDDSRTSESIILTKEAWLKIGEFKGWLNSEGGAKSVHQSDEKSR